MGRRSLKLPRGCKRYVDHTGKLRTYYRYSRPPTPLPGLPWSAEFMAAYEAAVARAGRDKPMIGASRTKPGSLDAALVKYYLSDDFTAMAKSSQGQNRGCLERWRVGRGERPLRELQHKHVQGYIGKLSTPSVQRNALRAIRPFMKFCLKQGLVSFNPSLGVEKAKMPKTGGFRAWTEDNVAQYTAKHPIGTKPYLALMIMLCLAVRRSDAVEIGPRHLRKTAEHPHGVLWEYRPKKGRRTGGNAVTVPLHEDLIAAIDAMTMIGTETYLITAYGKAFTAKGLGKKMREWCDEAGVPPLVDEATGKVKNVASHGLRKLSLTRLAECGLNVFQIAAVSGHKDLREVQLYVDAYNRKRAAAEAIAALTAAQNRNVVCLNGKDD
jgi:integrase